MDTLDMSAVDLYIGRGKNAARATREQVIRTASDYLLNDVKRGGSVLSNPSMTRDFLKMRLAGLSHEVFCVLHLDNRHRVIEFEEVFRGTIDGASVHPREVVKRVLAHNSAAVIFAHNHPSGVGEPSHADELITNRLKEALALIDVRVLDHLIVAGDTTVSFAERGLL